MVLKDELLRFCQSTSVKGIPRAVKAEENGIRYTWIISVFLFIGAGAYQVYLIVDEHLQYPSYVFSSEETFDPYKDKPVVPTLTFCNENPFSSLKAANLSAGIPSLQDYYLSIEYATQCPGCTAEQSTRMAVLRSLLQTPRAYFENLGHEKAELVGHDESEFILSCKEMVLFGSTLVERDCTELVTIKTHHDIDYFNCYRLQVSHSYDFERYGFVLGISVVLYLDNLAAESLGQPNITSILTNRYSDVRKFGAIVVPTHYQGHAFPSFDGIQLPAGISAKIQLFMEKQKRLAAPYGKCAVSPVQAYEHMKMCLSDCLQAITRNKCNCTDGRMVKQMDTEKYEFCMKVHSNPATMPERFHCANKQFNVDTLMHCESLCPQACLEISYTTETSFSKWPSSNSMASLYHQYILGRAYEPYFKIVKDVIEGNCTGELECTVKLLAAQRYIEDNFLEVKMHISDVKFMSTEQIPKLQLADLFSKVGGLLNLWAGITVVLILEIAEMLLRIAYRLIKRKKENAKKHLELKTMKEKQGNELSGPHGTRIQPMTSHVNESTPAPGLKCAWSW